jgi:hypothetical protein
MHLSRAMKLTGRRTAQYSAGMFPILYRAAVPRAHWGAAKEPSTNQQETSATGDDQLW